MAAVTIWEVNKQKDHALPVPSNKYVIWKKENMYLEKPLIQFQW